MENEAVATLPTQLNFKIAGGILLALLFPYIISAILIPLHLSSINYLFYSRFIYWLEVLVLSLYSKKVERQPLLIWEERNRDIMFFLGSVALLYFLSYSANIIAYIPHWFGLHDKMEAFKKIALLLKNHYFLLVFIAFTAGVTEELIFRGYILTRLTLLFKNNYAPLIISSVLFSAMHFGYHSLSEFIFTFLIGIICGLYYQKYRNIKAIIVVHFLIDIVSLSLYQRYIK